MLSSEYSSLKISWFLGESLCKPLSEQFKSSGISLSETTFVNQATNTHKNTAIKSDATQGYKTEISNLICGSQIHLKFNIQGCKMSNKAFVEICFTINLVLCHYETKYFFTQTDILVLNYSLGCQFMERNFSLNNYKLTLNTLNYFTTMKKKFYSFFYNRN